MADIFISYAREDRERVRLLADALEEEGWSVWWDHRLSAGEVFDKVIEVALDAARCVLVVWSDHSAESHWVRAEAHEGLERHCLVPVRFDGCRLPLIYRPMHTADLRNWDGNGQDPYFRSELLPAVRKLLGAAVSAKGQTERGTPSSPTEASRSPDPVETAPSRANEDRRGAGSVFRDRLRDGSEGPEMVVIPEGRFMMGSPGTEEGHYDDEGPQREVRIPRPFALGRCAVTFEEYERFSGATGRTPPEDAGWGKGRRPVINVSWEDASAYAQWLSKESGRPYRLPTEAEWEYAARAGTTTRYWWGDEIRQDGKVWANCNGCGSDGDAKQTAPAGSFAPNPWGLHDMLGNVWEWVEDCWHGSYTGAPGDGSAWLKENGGDCALRVVRGGSWSSGPRDVRSATATGTPPTPDTTSAFVSPRVRSDPLSSGQRKHDERPAREGGAGVGSGPDAAPGRACTRLGNGHR